MSEISKAFEAAKGHLPYGRLTLPYICVALDRAQWFGQISEKTREEAQKIIADRIAPYFVVEEWLEAYVEGYIPVGAEEIVQAYRHRWLDSLIEEFK